MYITILKGCSVNVTQRGVHRQCQIKVANLYLSLQYFMAVLLFEKLQINKHFVELMMSNRTLFDPWCVSERCPLESGTIEDRNLATPNVRRRFVRVG